MDGATIGAILAAGKSGGGVIASHARARQAAQDAQDARDKTRTATVPEIYALLGLGNLITATASGQVASFKTNVDLPIKKLQIGIEPVQTGSGDPSPENVRPITGWSGVKLQRTGKNLSSLQQINNGVARAYWGTSSSQMVPVLNTLKAGTYTISVTYEVVSLPDSGNVSHGPLYLRTATRELYPSTKTVDTSPAIGKKYRDSATFTLTEDEVGKIAYCYAYCDRDVAPHSGDGRGTYLAYDIQLELGSIATAYEPYQGSTYDLSFGDAGTIYGGTLDVISGELVVDRAMLDLGTKNWSYATVSGGNQKRFYAGITGVDRPKIPTDLSQKVGLVCSAFDEKLPNQYNKAVNGITVYTNNSIQVYEESMANMTNEEFKIAVSGVQLVYELATPQTYHLTPLQVRTLIGQNRIWADTGETAVTYYRKE